MPTQVYSCPEHGEYDIALSFKDEIPAFWRCPVDVEADGVGGVFCDERSPHILKPPAGIKVVRTWNEQANEWQRDPYTQAKAQATNMYNEQRDAGIDIPMPTERDYQIAASQIAKPQPQLTERQRAVASYKKV